MSKRTQLHLTAPKNFSDAQIAQFNALLERTNQANPDPDDVRALRQILADNPSLTQQAGDLAALALKRVAAYAIPQVVGQESILLTAGELRRALTLPTDTSLEALVIEQCVAAYLLHSATQLRYMSSQENGLPPDQSNVWENRLTGSQRRLLRAVESLARLRNLSQPLMQINIAKHQTNIAATAPATTIQE